jgi:DNA invertase Pin-like site-specific DNA recombinase
LPAIQRMLAKGEVHALVVPSLTMLGGSLDEIVETVSRLVSAKAVLLVAGEIDSTTTQGAAWMAAVASLRGFRRALRHQSARAGQLRAREAGVRFGRPLVPDSTIERVRIALAQGHGVRPTARRMGISPARVSAEKQAMKSAGHISQAENGTTRPDRAGTGRSNNVRSSR